MKVAIVCDFLTKFGGAQRVLLALAKAFPDADLFCLLYDEQGTKGKFSGRSITESPLGNLPSFLKRRTKFFLSSLPKAIESFDLSKYDIVISSSDSFAHGVITKPLTFHVCYCHTPMRYAWDWHHEYLRENHLDKGIKSLFVRNILHKIRIWDRVAAHRVDSWIANSENVKKRIKKYYQADAKVIYPPVDFDNIPFSPGSKPEEYYVIVSRLEPYKRVGLAVEAFNSLGKKLKIVGEGSQLSELKSAAKDNVEFLGWQSDKQMYDILSKAKGLIFPGEEDFGITPVESFAAGRPVVAFKKGGTLESVIENKTGVFFDEPNAESLSRAVNHLEEIYNTLESKVIHQHAENFSEKHFIGEIQSFVMTQYRLYMEEYGDDKKNN